MRNFNTNEKLFSFDVVESDKFAFCQTEVEPLSIYCFPEKDPVIFENMACPSLQTADAFPVVASLHSLFFGGREATTGNASAVGRLALSWLQDDNMIVEKLKKRIQSSINLILKKLIKHSLLLGKHQYIY